MELVELYGAIVLRGRARRPRLELRWSREFGGARAGTGDSRIAVLGGPAGAEQKCRSLHQAAGIVNVSFGPVVVRVFVYCKSVLGTAFHLVLLITLP
jgi:hypothetical protein